MRRRSTRWIAVALLALLASWGGCTFKPIVNPPFALSPDESSEYHRQEPANDSFGSTAGGTQSPRTGIGTRPGEPPPMGHPVASSPDAGAPSCPSVSDAGAPCECWTVADGMSPVLDHDGGASMETDAGVSGDEADEPDPDGETPE
jgi:hypothetical protein